MSTDAQIPRVSLLWLLAAQVAVILPHLQRMPWWIMLIWLLCALWRLAMFRGDASHPGKLLRATLIVLGCIGTGISFGGLGGLDIAVALLILAFCLKLTEVKERRDLNLVFFLAFFIIATSFLFSQTLALAAYQVLCILFVLTAMVATQYSYRNRTPLQALRVSSKLVLQAVPIMLVFFVVFPRLEPLWKVPDFNRGAKTGMSDSMTPGDFAKLNRSDELAFIASFDGPVPARDRLYWRGMTLQVFDGRTWRRDIVAELPAAASLPLQFELLDGESLDYQVIMEPTGQHWLYTLPVAARAATSELAINKSKYFANGDFAFTSYAPILKKTRFEFQSFPYARFGRQLPTEQLEAALELPQGYNPRAIALARQMYAETGTTQSFVGALQQMITQQEYYYTLEPPALGEHSVDEFLFETRRGFCEHYASASVVMLRAVGIPSRIVVGYQGGEYNPMSDTLAVRQFDAHAWAEYWLPGEGWLRLDPTAFVAPSRIALGMQGALESDDSIEAPVLSSLYYRNLPLIKELRLRAEALNHGWQNWVVNFDRKKQSGLLEKILGDVTPLRTGLLVLGVLGLSLGLAGIVRLLKHRDERLPTEQLYYQRFLHKLSRLGLERGGGEAPGRFAQRIAEQYPALAAEVLGITQQFEQMAYAGQAGPAQRSELRKRVSQFKPQNSLKN